MATVRSGPNGIDMISGISLAVNEAPFYIFTDYVIRYYDLSGYSLSLNGVFYHFSDQVPHGVVSWFSENDNGSYRYTIEAAIDIETFLTYAYAGDVPGLMQRVLSEADTINGALNAHNILVGYAGNDTMVGGNLDDLLDGGVGNDTMSGGAGNDTYVVGDAGDTIVETSGIDTVQSWIPYTLPAGLENLVLLGTALYGIGNAADNSITGNDAANSLLRGDAGADTIAGHGGNDWIEGETGNDPFAGVAGNDVLDGGDGDDTILAGGGDDIAYGGAGTDFLIGEGGNDTLYGGADWDAIDGRDGADILFGDGGADIIFGDAGQDQIDGGDGDDLIMGERGENTSIGDNDTIVGGAGNDMLDGSAGDDLIVGGIGNDIIDGDVGNDRIIGGPGAEIIAGSDYNHVAGRDTFVYDSVGDAGDRIYGFRTVVGDSDKIDLTGIFNGAGYAGTTPRADGYLMFQQNGGDTQVYVDANGPPGGANWVLLLTLVQTTLDPSHLDGYFVYQ